MLSTSPVWHLESFFNIDPETDAAHFLSLNEKQRSADDLLKDIVHATPSQKAQHKT